MNWLDMVGFQPTPKRTTTYVLLTVVLCSIVSPANSDQYTGSSVPKIVVVNVTAKSPTTMEVSWTDPYISSMKEWVIYLSLTRHKHDIVSFAKLVPENRKHIITGLLPNTSYFIFLDSKLQNNEYVTWLKEPIRCLTLSDTHTAEVTNGDGGDSAVNGGEERKGQRAGSSRSDSESRKASSSSTTTTTTTTTTTITTITPTTSTSSSTTETSGGNLNGDKIDSRNVDADMGRLLWRETSSTITPTYGGHSVRNSVGQPHGSKESNDTGHPDPDYGTFSGQDTTVPVGTRVAQAQRQRLLWWIYLVGGAGLGLIVILSALTVLCYRPRARKQYDITMRKKSGEEAGQKIKILVPSPEPVSDKKREVGEEEEEEEGLKETRYITVAELVPNRARIAQSLISWGSEFDVREPPAENIYSNDDGVHDNPEYNNAPYNLPPPPPSLLAPSVNQEPKRLSKTTLLMRLQNVLGVNDTPRVEFTGTHVVPPPAPAHSYTTAKNTNERVYANTNKLYCNVAESDGRM